MASATTITISSKPGFTICESKAPTPAAAVSQKKNEFIIVIRESVEPKPIKDKIVADAGMQGGRAKKQICAADVWQFHAISFDTDDLGSQRERRLLKNR
ncbi:hypothetical protein [Allorhodopirellula heiligendammensis]|uniref:hypothetical protein n=1 Tax=Allorhodopirellula heiligendammensis TaxID=2714739 RepID=UPI00265E6009|nr:hypothetical protein [Allorhodopirellula heiligendammensis]